MPDLLDEFAGALVARAEHGIPPLAVREVRRTILNVLGATIGASARAETDMLVAAATHLGRGEVEPLGRAERLSPSWAACVIGFCAHLDDFDDTHLATVIHPGAATLGAWHALGATTEAISPERALVAFALGIESQLRVGIAMSPSHYDDGWHITGTCGVIGAAVVTAIGLGLDRAGVAAAIALAANMTLGHRETFGTPVKAFHAGKAAANGFLAAKLAACGFHPEIDPLAEEPGFFGALSHDHDLEVLCQSDVAQRLVLLDNTYKPYPCGIVAHPAIEAAIALHRVLAQSVAQITEVHVSCNPLVPELMGRTDCATGLEARFCAIHGVAVGLLFGRAGLAEFADEIAAEPVVRALRGRTTLVASAAVPREAAVVSVSFADGRVVRHEVRVAEGSLARPLSDEALLAKFTALVEPIAPGRARAIADVAMGIGEWAGPNEIRHAVSAAAP